MGGSGISKSQVSRLREEIDERVDAFLERPIEGEWPYLRIDATYLKAGGTGASSRSPPPSRGGRFAFVRAAGVNIGARREIPGMDIGLSEAGTFWTGFLRKLVRRGLRGVKLVVLDAHEGIKAAVSKVFAAASNIFDATWQRCRVQFASRRLRRHAQSPGSRRQAGSPRRLGLRRHGLRAGRRRNRQDQVAQGGRPAVAEGAQAGRPDGRGGERRARLHDLPGGAPDQAALDQLAGRLDGEAGRRTDVVGTIPDDAAIKRLAGAILPEQNDEQAVQRTRTMSLGTIANIGDDPLAALSAMAAVRPARPSRGSRRPDISC